MWIGSSLADVRAFPVGVRRDIGHALNLLQEGLQPPDWRPMPSVGQGVVELRLHQTTEYRIIYVAKYHEAIYVLHAFEKKTRKTPAVAIALAQRRFRQLHQIRGTR